MEKDNFTNTMNNIKFLPVNNIDLRYATIGKTKTQSSPTYTTKKKML